MLDLTCKPLAPTSLICRLLCDIDMSLPISGNRIGAEGVQTLSGVLGPSSRIVSLILAGEESRWWFSLPAAACWLTLLHHAAGNDIDGKAAKALAMTLERNTTVTKLDLSGQRPQLLHPQLRCDCGLRFLLQPTSCTTKE